jgi:hypothetical protein
LITDAHAEKNGNAVGTPIVLAHAAVVGGGVRVCVRSLKVFIPISNFWIPALLAQKKTLMFWQSEIRTIKSKNNYLRREPDCEKTWENTKNLGFFEQRDLLRCVGCVGSVSLARETGRKECACGVACGSRL